MSEQPIFAIIVPSAADLSAPIAPSIELSKLYIMAAKKVQQLQQQTRVIVDHDEQGHEVIRIADHPDLKWWFDQCRKIGSDIAKLIANVEGKEIESKIKLMDLIMNSEMIPQETREAIAKMAIKQKLKGETPEPINIEGT